MYVCDYVAIHRPQIHHAVCVCVCILQLGKDCQPRLHVNSIIILMHLSMQSPLPPTPPGEGRDLSQGGCKRHTPEAEIFG